MGATIAVTYRRTWQVKPYETQTVELSVSDTTELKQGDPRVEQEAGALYRRLNALGDKLMCDALTSAPASPVLPAPPMGGSRR
jgi:hypothetical protein